MRSIVIHKAKDLRIEETDVQAPKAGEVLVRIATGGICGSDLHYYNHGGFGTIKVKEPMILGHEVSGYIERLALKLKGLPLVISSRFRHLAPATSANIAWKANKTIVRI